MSSPYHYGSYGQPPKPPRMHFLGIIRTVNGEWERHAGHAPTADDARLWVSRQAASRADVVHGLILASSSPDTLDSQFAKLARGEFEGRREEMERGRGGDHDAPYKPTIPESAVELLGWTRLMGRVRRGEIGGERDGGA